MYSVCEGKTMVAGMIIVPPSLTFKFDLCLMLLMIMMLSGCSSDANLPLATVATIPTNASTDVYLLPAVNSRSITEAFNDTTYYVWNNGRFIGKWGISPVGCVNATNSTSLCPAFTLRPGDSLDLLSVTNSSPYPEYYRTSIPDKAAYYVQPQVLVPTLYDFWYSIYDNSRIAHVNSGDNISIPAMQDYELRMLVNPAQQQRIFNYLCCNHVGFYVSLNSRSGGLMPIAEEGCAGGDFYDLRISNEYSLLLTGVAGERFLSCAFMDKAYYISHAGAVSAGVVDDDWNDLGLINPTFNLTINFTE